MSDDRPITRGDTVEALRSAGVAEGQSLIVHASLSSIGNIIGGAETVVRAILECVGPSGTVVAPTQTWLNMDPARGVHGIPKKWWDVLRAELPGYDKTVTPSVGMGAVAEMIRTWPGAQRSQHPVRSWSAVGARAREFLAEHDLEDVHGDRSPLGALYRARGRVLCLGVGYEKCTALHLAESRAVYPGKRWVRETSWIATPSGRQPVTYRNIRFDDSDFAAIGEAYEVERAIRPVRLGKALLRYLDLVDLVDFANRWISRKRSLGQ